MCTGDFLLRCASGISLHCKLYIYIYIYVREVTRTTGVNCNDITM
jgi:hypothetical protein